jgi:hypothetical protein
MAWEEPQSVVVAFGPHGELVQIYNDKHFDKWHHRGGLHCVDCGRNMRIKHRIDAPPEDPKRWLAHESDAEGKTCDSDRKTRGPAAHYKVIIGQWIKDKLRELGHDVTEVPADAPARIDILTRSGTRRIAMRLELRTLDADVQSADDAALKEAGYETLWITHDCQWVAQARAIGIKPAPTDPGNGSTTRIADVFVSVDQGLLAHGPSGFVLWKEPIRFERYLVMFMSGEVVQAQFGDLTGWALPDHIQRHVKDLHHRVASLTSDLAAAEGELTKAQRQKNEAEQAARVAAASRGRVQGELVKAQDAIRAQSEEQRRTLDWVEKLEAVRDRSVIVRSRLQSLAPFTKKPGQGPEDEGSVTAWWKRAMPWGVAGLVLVLPLLPFFFRVPLPPPWGPWAASALITLCGCAAVWCFFSWCWARNGDRTRCLRRKAKLFGRCPEIRTHGLNVFDLLGVLGGVEATALVLLVWA